VSVAALEIEGTDVIAGGVAFDDCDVNNIRGEVRAASGKQALAFMVKHEMLTRQPELAIRPGPPGGRPVHELPGEVDRCLKKRVVFEVSKSVVIAQ
jgi:hypothetical protein